MHTHAHHSAASTDPDALLAIISENMNVLDNFNLKETDDEVSDSEHLKGHYEEYLSSENDYTGDEGRKGNRNKLVYMTKNSPSRHYSGLAAHPKVNPQLPQNAPEPVEGMYLCGVVFCLLLYDLYDLASFHSYDGLSTDVFIAFCAIFSLFLFFIGVVPLQKRSVRCAVLTTREELAPLGKRSATARTMETGESCLKIVFSISI